MVEAASQVARSLFSVTDLPAKARLASRRLPTYPPAMNPEAVIATLRANEAALRLKGVAHAAVFGSVARGEAGPDSDIDIMVEIDPAAEVGVWEFVGITHFIGDLFPVKVDVFERKALKAMSGPMPNETPSTLSKHSTQACVQAAKLREPHVSASPL